MVATLYRKVSQAMPREQKEKLIYDDLMKNDRIFAKNCREMDLAFGFGRETAHKFVAHIEKEEKTSGRNLEAPEIEEIYQKTLEGIKNGNGYN
ncbi:MAG TPA: hypothetical protein VFE71_06355 [Bacteroidales bacterium]|nr:hypothetical protein [Bacteroidales bacterium]